MIQSKILKNGITVLYEKLDFVRSATIGIWVKNGSRFETAEENGASHFIEHMLFKGTNSRTSAQIAEQMDAIGGQFNAFTTKECTSFYFRALDTMLDRGIDVLTDMLTDSVFPENEVDTERGVIDEEIDMYEDTPDELVADNLFKIVFPDSPLGRPIVGYHDTISHMDSQFLKNYMKTHYVGGNIVAAVSGNFSDENIDRLCSLLSVIPENDAPKFEPAHYTQSSFTCVKPIEQVHTCLGFPSMSLVDPKRYALSLFSNILCGGTSSRLFRKMREENGLCYSVYSFNSSHLDTGISGVYFATNISTYKDASEMAIDELKKLLRDGPSSEEFERARDQIISNVLMGLESTMSRMNSMARSLLMQGHIISADEVVDAYNALDISQCIEAGVIGYDPDKVSCSIVGNIKE